MSTRDALLNDVLLIGTGKVASGASAFEATPGVGADTPSLPAS